MSKRVVIIPNFGESHLIECQIPNLVDTLAPDVVIYNEGLFPNGPESKTQVDKDFRKRYCYGDTNLAWDTETTQKLITQAQIDYPDTLWVHNEMKFPEHLNGSQAYVHAVSNFEEVGITVEPGDYIFPYEPDIFHLESLKEGISFLLDQLQPDQGFTSIWLDFLETQHYIEANNNPYIGRPRGRKIAIRYGTLDFYKQVVGEFESQNYSMLFKSDLITFHYNWFRFEKNKQLRFDQIVRKPEYWAAFEEGLQKMRYNSMHGIEEDVILRPSRLEGDFMRYGSYIDIEHPLAIRAHHNWVNKY